MTRRRAERNPVQGTIKGVLDTGKGKKSGELTRDEVDALDAPTERTGRLRPGARMFDQMRGTDPTHKRFER